MTEIISKSIVKTYKLIPIGFFWIFSVGLTQTAKKIFPWLTYDLPPTGIKKSESILSQYATVTYVYFLKNQLIQNQAASGNSWASEASVRGFSGLSGMW